MQTTVIRNADYVIAWDAAAGSHAYLEGADVAFRDNEFTFVGKGYAGPADKEISGRGLMVMPGLVNIHSHPSSEPGNKGLLEELGSPRLGQSSLYEFMPIFRLDPEAARAATMVAMSELLKSGVTTIADLSGARDGWADDLASTGLRGVLCPMFRSASWTTTNGHSVEYHWDEAAGKKAMQKALDLIDAAAKHPSGRISGMVGPSQIDTCTEELIRDSYAAAQERGIAMQIHAAQSVVEFNEITRRHGKTPIEWLDSLGVLGPDAIIGHGIFLNDHPWLHWPHGDDFGLLRDSGASVAHCPTVFSRRGIALNWVSRYAQAGINLGLGTDTFPHNMIDEMRMACLAARILKGDFKGASTAEVFTAATVGGAKALKKPDIGRVAIGAKADFSLVDLSHPYMQPLREPLRSLIYSTSDRAIKDVYVDGQQVVKDGQVLTIDVEAAIDTLRAAQARTVATVSERDWAKRQIEDMSPMVFPVQATVSAPKPVSKSA
ncbi:MAG: amidohydrolase family protein [Alphaproteobacteria bacterium]|nr:amidohydrolase family protein [Alphaproteobacteria bacterium]MBU0797671.1 amidohydrolase family protein [Alphaproteobacteria bacterium]MBU0887996.1 amidohydrolase family protein [Alphaproteobacteria bacterium]MBU1811673.1 amidohydrolase family protein [Alphaproteobacteria bacterium]MBU2089149.1 amidohydrolase family protein [Alphaproteobacteria bacterium]